MTDARKPLTGESDIAIVGLAGRFPGARTAYELWENVRDGVESICTYSDEELRAAGVPSSLLRNPRYVKVGAPLPGMEEFDARFFSFSPRDAAILDPQHRHLLEVAWEAFEDSGHIPSSFDGSIGVFAGCGMQAYMSFNLLTNPELVESTGLFLLRHTGNDKDFLTTRVSYCLNLTGPSVNVQTACSTSLVAVHTACQSLLHGECDMALAGGVTIEVPHRQGYLYREGEILSPNGRCRPFDAQANGTVFGSGAAVLVLRRLADALQDGDHVHAVIKGSAVNNDGAIKVSYLAPGFEGQAQVVEEALAVSGVDPATIGLLETHSTGTALGDSIEIAALTQAFRSGTERKEFCALGSVKGNIGHLDTAAGVAGMIKAILALENAQIPPCGGFERVHPDIDLEGSPFYVNTELRNWQASESPRRAAVSALGVGGTNAHAILEQAPPAERTEPAPPWQLLVFSGKSGAAATRNVQRLAAHLRKRPDLDLADAAYTLQTGREAFTHRCFLVCRDGEDAVAALAAENPPSLFSGQTAEEDPRIVFVFPGAGTQFLAMGLDLYQTEPLYRQSIDRCSDILRTQLGGRPGSSMDAERGEMEAPSEEWDRPSRALPALFASEYALAQLWISWGIRPAAVIGHGVGEFAAACLSGIVSLEDALTLVALRAGLLESREADSDRIRASLSQLTLEAPTVRFVSSVTGTWIRAEEATAPDYWARRVGNTVRFTEGLEVLMAERNQIFLELGPSSALLPVPGEAQPDRERGQEFLSCLRGRNEAVHDRQRLLTSLGRVWLAGARVDWNGVHSGSRRRRIPLPTYAFDHQRYWIEARGPERIATTPPRLRRLKNLQDWSFRPVWRRADLDPAKPGTGSSRGSTRWLVFQDRAGLGAEIASRLEARGDRVVTVREGDAFHREGRGCYALAPESGPGEYAALVAGLASDGDLPDRIIHLWSVTGEDDHRSASNRFHHHQERGFLSLLFISQALIGERANSPLDVAVVSNGMQSVAGESLLFPEKATLLGPVQVIPHEIPRWTWRSVDVAMPPTRRGRFISTQCTKVIQPLAEQLIAELEAGPVGVPVAYRERGRWEQHIERVRLEPRGPGPGRLRRKGVYLITGGLGEIGMAVADHLAATLEARLVLVGRTALPDRFTWDRRPTHHPGDIMGRRIDQIRRLEGSGAEVLVESADVSNSEQMKSVLERVHTRFGRIHGVIHAAGTMEERVAALKSEDAVNRVLTPKVQGTLVLDELLREEGLDFFLLFSSTSTILGPTGQVDYTAANCFLNAFAESRAEDRSVLTTALNWGMWKVGLSREASKRLQRSASGAPVPRTEELPGAERFALDAYEAGIQTNEGIEALSRVLESEPPALLFLSSVDPEELVEHHRVSLVGSAGGSPRFTRPDLSHPYEPARDEIERTLTSYWEEFLGVEPVGVHDDFFELGGHSLIAVRLFAKLKERYRLDFPLSVLLEAPTIASCAQLVRAELGQTEGLGDLPARRRQPRFSFLIPVKEGNEEARAPLFLVAGKFGNILNLRHLAVQLGEDQPVYGIQARGLRGDENPHTRFEEMASDFLREVCAVQPRGPYYLGGFSGGGITAFEMAQQLVVQGERVGMLAFLDTSAPRVPNVTWGDRLRIQWLNTRRHGPTYPFRWVLWRSRFELERLRSLFERPTDDLPPAVFRSRRVEAGFLEALEHYEPRVYPGRVHLFRPPLEEAYVLGKDRVIDTHLSRVDSCNHWAPFVAGGIDVHVVEGTHSSIVLEPQVRVLAEKLRVCLDEAYAAADPARKAGEANPRARNRDGPGALRGGR